MSLCWALKYALRPLPRRFIVYNSDQKIYIESEHVGVYPDALVICDEPQFWQGREDLIVNPLLRSAGVASPLAESYEHVRFATSP